MSQLPSDDVIRPAQHNDHPEQPGTHKSEPGQRKWINMPAELPEWLSKRIEFSMPIWALTIAAIVVSILVFD